MRENWCCFFFFFFFFFSSMQDKYKFNMKSISINCFPLLPYSAAFGVGRRKIISRLGENSYLDEARPYAATNQRSRSLRSRAAALRTGSGFA
jgi:hypothetical protein